MIGPPKIDRGPIVMGGKPAVARDIGQLSFGPFGATSGKRGIGGTREQTMGLAGGLGEPGVTSTKQMFADLDITHAETQAGMAVLEQVAKDLAAQRRVMTKKFGKSFVRRMDETIHKLATNGDINDLPPVGDPLRPYIDELYEIHQKGRIALGMSYQDGDSIVDVRHQRGNDYSFPIGRKPRTTGPEKTPLIVRALESKSGENPYFRQPTEGHIPNAHKAMMEMFMEDLRYEDARQKTVTLNKWIDAIDLGVAQGKVDFDTASAKIRQLRTAVQGMEGDRVVDRKLQGIVDWLNTTVITKMGFEPVDAVGSKLFKAIRRFKNFTALTAPMSGVNRALSDPLLQLDPALHEIGGSMSGKDFLAEAPGTKQFRAARSLETVVGIDPFLSPEVLAADYGVGGAGSKLNWLSPNMQGNAAANRVGLVSAFRNMFALGRNPEFLVKASKDFTLKYSTYMSDIASIDPANGELRIVVDAKARGITTEDAKRQRAEAIFGSDYRPFDPDGMKGLTQEQRSRWIEQRMYEEGYVPLGGNLHQEAADLLVRSMFIQLPGSMLNARARFPETFGTALQYSEPSIRQFNNVWRWGLESKQELGLTLAAGLAAAMVTGNPWGAGIPTLAGFGYTLARNAALRSYVINLTALTGSRAFLNAYNAMVTAGAHAPGARFDYSTVLAMFDGDEYQANIFWFGLPAILKAQIGADQSVLFGNRLGFDDDESSIRDVGLAMLEGYIGEQVSGNVRTAINVAKSDDPWTTFWLSTAPGKAVLRGKGWAMGEPYLSTTTGQPIEESVGTIGKREAKYETVAPPGHLRSPGQLTRFVGPMSEFNKLAAMRMTDEELEQYAQAQKRGEVSEFGYSEFGYRLDKGVRSMDPQRGIGKLLPQNTGFNALGGTSPSQLVPGQLQRDVRARQPKPNAFWDMWEGAFRVGVVYDMGEAAKTLSKQYARKTGEIKKVEGIPDEFVPTLTPAINRWANKLPSHMRDETVERNMFQEVPLPESMRLKKDPYGLKKGEVDPRRDPVLKPALEFFLYEYNVGVGRETKSK